MSDKVLLHFIESATERISTCLIHIHALEQILLQKNLITETELLNAIHEAEKWPEVLLGKKTLQEILKKENSDEHP